MTVTKLILPIIAAYLLGMLLFWFKGEGTQGWNTYFYALEKSATAVGFVLLALSTHSRYIMRLSLYMASVCVFLFMYYIYCLFFGHHLGWAIGSFLFYSLIILFLLYQNTRK